MRAATSESPKSLAKPRAPSHSANSGAIPEPAPGVPSGEREMHAPSATHRASMSVGPRAETSVIEGCQPEVTIAAFQEGDKRWRDIRDSSPRGAAPRDLPKNRDQALACSKHARASSPALAVNRGTVTIPRMSEVRRLQPAERGGPAVLIHERPPPASLSPYSCF